MINMSTTDRITFLAEWKDPFSSMNWKFHLFFYLWDETLELYDLLKHRLFLKRTKCEDIRLEDLYIGATVRICSRLIHIKDYGDSYTRSKVELSSQKCCGFLKPHIGNRKGEILRSFLKHGLKIINLKMVQLSESEARILLDEYEDESILESVIQYVTSGPVLAFELLGENAIHRCHELIGPEDPENAKIENAESFRARYGTDKIHNAIYISASPQSAEKDAKILFDSKDSNLYKPVALLKDSTCCVIKPHAVKAGLTGDIINVIEESGYEILNICMCILSTEQAEKFYEVYKYVVEEYKDMVQELCSGACVAMEVKGQSEKETHSEFRKLIGPLDVEIAKCIRPNTIRARFGETKVRNSVHVTELMDDCSRELQFFLKLHANSVSEFRSASAVHCLKN